MIALGFDDRRAFAHWLVEEGIDVVIGDGAEWCRKTLYERSAELGTEFEREGESLIVGW